MNDLLKKGVAYVILLLGVISIFYHILGEDLFRLNEVQFDTSGDGFKNYFSFAYQYQYGSGMHFDGLLYPFGDMAVYADGQVIIVWLLQLFKMVGLDVSSSLIGIVNGLPLLCCYVGTVCLYHIYKHFGVHWMASVLFAIICMALSPQLLRVQSHFALAYPFIPMLWLYLLKHEAHLTFGKIIVLTGALFCSGFVHPYHIFILSTFIFLLATAILLKLRLLRHKLYLCSILPMLLFYGLVKLIDPYDDRPSNPFGLEHHNTIWGDLLPYYGWFRDCFDGVVIYRPYYSEGYAYLGCLLLILPIYLIGRSIYNIRGEKSAPVEIPHTYLFAGLAALFLGAGLHVLFTGGLILELLPPLKQFRGLGRLSWIYYYIIFVILSIGFYQLVSRIKSPAVRVFLFLVVLVIWMHESQHYHRTIGANYQKYSTSNNFKDRHIIQDMLAAVSMDHSYFQAAYTLPASTEGVEKIDIHDDWHTKMYAMEYAYQSGLPLTACVMSRSPVSSVLAVQQLSNPHFRHKNLVFQEDKRPYLIIIQNERIPEYEDVLAKATYINKDEYISLYEVTPEDILSHERIEYDSLTDAVDLSGGELSQQGIVFADFEDHSATEGLAGAGALFLETGSHYLIDHHPVVLDSATDYFVSVWYRVEADWSGIPVFYLITYDEYENQLEQIGFRDLNAGRLLVHDDWIRLKVPFSVTERTAMISLRVDGHYNSIDKVLVCPQHVSTYLKLGTSQLIYTDHTIKSK